MGDTLTNPPPGQDTQPGVFSGIPGLLGDAASGVGSFLRKADQGLFSGLANLTSPTGQDPVANQLEDAYMRAIGLPAVDRAEQQRNEGRRALLDLAVGIGQFAGRRYTPVTFGEVLSGALAHTLGQADQRAGAQQAAMTRRMQLGQALYSINKQQQGQAAFRYMLGLASGQVPGAQPQTGAAGTPNRPTVGTVTAAPMVAPGDHGQIIAAAYQPVEQFESGGKPDARPVGPDGKLLSSAYGPAQFIDGTWLKYYRQAHPDTGETDQEILAKRTDPGLNKELFQLYGADNARTLTGAGQPVTPATIALSHFLDGGTAAKVLASPHNTPLDQIIGQKAYDANKGFFDKQGITTSGSLVDYYNRRFPSQPGATTAQAGGAPGPAGAPGGQGFVNTAFGPLPAPVVALAAAAGQTDPEKGYTILMQAWQQQAQASNAPVRPPTAGEIATYHLDPQQSWGINTVTGQPQSLGSKRDDPQQQAFTREDTLRGEFLKLPEVQKYMQATSAYTNLRRAAATGTGGVDPVADINLVYAVANLFDPGSVVREGEQLAFVRAGGLPQQLLGAIATVNGQGKLGDTVRSQIVRAGDDRMRGYWEAVQPHVDAYRNLTGQYPGTRADRVVTLRSPEQLIAAADERGKVPLEPVPPAPASTTPAPASTTPAPASTTPAPASTTPAPTGPYQPPAKGSEAFQSTTPPQNYDTAARERYYAQMSAADFDKLEMENIPWFERTLVTLEYRKRVAAAAAARKGKK